MQTQESPPTEAATSAPEVKTETPRELGTVTTYLIMKAYGFILADDRTSLFFHVREVCGAKAPNRGDRVSFRRTKDRKDREHATDVRIETSSE